MSQKKTSTFVQKLHALWQVFTERHVTEKSQIGCSFRSLQAIFRDPRHDTAPLGPVVSFTLNIRLGSLANPFRHSRDVHKTLRHKTETRPTLSNFETETRKRRSIFQTLKTETRPRRWTLKTEMRPRRSNFPNSRDRDESETFNLQDQDETETFDFSELSRPIRERDVPKKTSRDRHDTDPFKIETTSLHHRPFPYLPDWFYALCPH